jgi:hypothetical protein
MIYRLIFMTLHTALSWYNIQSKLTMMNSKCPKNESVCKCYKLLLHEDYTA